MLEKIRPSKLSLEQVKQIFRAMVYIAISSAITSLITYVEKNPDMFGVYYPIVNLVVVFVKKWFTPAKEQ